MDGETPCDHKTPAPWRIKLMAWMLRVLLQLSIWIIGAPATGMLLFKVIALAFYDGGVNRELAKERMAQEIGYPFSTL